MNAQLVAHVFSGGSPYTILLLFAGIRHRLKFLSQWFVIGSSFCRFRHSDGFRNSFADKCLVEHKVFAWDARLWNRVVVFASQILRLKHFRLCLYLAVFACSHKLCARHRQWRCVSWSGAVLGACTP